MTSQLTNAQVALQAAALATRPGNSDTTKMVLKRADAFKAWLDARDDEDRDKAEL